MNLLPPVRHAVYDSYEMKEKERKNKYILENIDSLKMRNKEKQKNLFMRRRFAFIGYFLNGSFYFVESYLSAESNLIYKTRCQLTIGACASKQADVPVLIEKKSIHNLNARRTA